MKKLKPKAAAPVDKPSDSPKLLPAKLLKAPAAAPTGGLHPPVQFPPVGNGEWKDMLKLVDGNFTVELDTGAFLWLWEWVENRHTFASQSESLNGHGEDFREAYRSVSRRTVHEFRKAAAHRYKLVKPKSEPTEAPKPKKGSKK